MTYFNKLISLSGFKIVRKCNFEIKNEKSPQFDFRSKKILKNKILNKILKILNNKILKNKNFIFL